MLKSLLPLAAIAALASPSVATAGTPLETQAVMAAGTCQSALPVFDGVIRKRPLAVQNEGDSSAFITCGMEGVLNASAVTSEVTMALTNTADVEVIVNCTLVDGRAGFSNPVYLVNSIKIAPNAPLGILTWAAADNGGDNFVYPAISCALPPGAGIIAVGREIARAL